ncbi:hypothetical protein BOW53_00685 [Solemya pervernicosa gill symbiont]|uniref:Methyl-accepting chemotaxis protein n=1 Tax=Solemya pervernicosa gill symbiont TaxID=642797 RepID=A0A1T2LAN6_9GAMM|nr:methyl-accepting chemotaxis protein [Solemya pervernicosa gill symbiont]OOZ42130.1 hypothetical protein BOW53_00685 [Solemya pervernicosa gill symbiont]
MKIKNKLTLGASLLALIPVVATALIIETMAVNTGREALELQARNQLVSIRDIKKTQIEDYFGTIRNQVVTFSSNLMVAHAMEEFKAAFHSYASDATDADSEQMKQKLTNYYGNEFGAEYKNQNPGSSIDTGGLMNRLDDAGLALQYRYIAANSQPLGNKNGLTDPQDGTPYGDVHKHYHDTFNQYLETFGYYDIFLIDPDTGHVIYSVFKELDYATSLNDGAYANSGLAEAFKAANQGSTPDHVSLIDFSPYTPSYEGAASFIASPIYLKGKKVGILVFQMPVDNINTVMTSGEKWSDIGLGASGETYLVGGDYKMRSMSRFLIEDKSGYLDLLKEVGVSPGLVDTIGAKGTSIGLQPIETQGTRAAIGGERGFAIFDDYRNVAVLSAYTPLDIPGLRWAIMSEIDEAEAFASVDEMESTIISTVILVTLVVVALALAVGYMFANAITRPILKLSGTIEKIERESDLSQRVDINSKDELGLTADAFNKMVSKFQHIIESVNGSTTQLASAAEEMNAVTEETETAIRQQLSETEQVATAMNEMTATVQEVARNATSAASSTQAANAESSNGRAVVTATMDAIDSLAGEVEKAANVIHKLESETESIGTVLDVIKGIAEQTNLLALNAAIEAARAGEQGRGFAVVADEVRTLAQRTQESTREIEDMIERLQSGAGDAVAVMDESRSQAESSVQTAAKAGESLQTITAAVAEVADMNTQIASAAEEQSAVAEEINRNVVNINEVAEATAAGAQQTASASGELARLASNLQSLVAQFKV